MPHHDDDYKKWRDKFHGDGKTEEPYDYVGSPNPKKLFRSRHDRVIAGVCGGIAERFGWEPILLRVVAVALFFFVAGPLIVLAYLVAWMVTPKQPRYSRDLSPDEDTFWRGVSDRPGVTFSNIRYKFMDLDDRLQNLERSVTSDEWRLRRQFQDLERS